MEKTKIKIEKKIHPDQELKMAGPLCEKDEEARAIEHARMVQDEISKKLEEWRKKIDRK
jgi:hypothetical protein